jgi:uncharacterized protein (DUF2252 family)
MKKQVNWISVAKRATALKAARNLKMSESTQVFVRGSTVKFYEWLDSSHTIITVPEGPAVWICGDCHIGNLGPIANSNGDVAIEIRDLDQTVIGNPAHDLIRLGLSLAMSARDSNLPGVTTAQMIEQLMVGYEQSFVRNPGRMTDIEKPAAVTISMKQALARSWKHLANERIGGVSPKIPLGKRFWPLKKTEERAIAELFLQDELIELKASLRPDGRKLPIKIVDAAYWMKGCSSLGLLRYAVLVKFDEPAEKGGDMYLIDIKEAIQASAPHHKSAQMPKENGLRVVEGARQLAPSLGRRMVAANLLDRSVFLRELSPHDLKLEINQFGCNEAMLAARFLGRVVGKAHARQMDVSARKSWHRQLLNSHTKTLDAPTWLWTSVVELVGSHEQAYLEHCRRFAMNR